MLDHISSPDAPVCFEYDKTTDRLIMNDEALRLFGLKRARFSGSTESLFRYFNADDKRIIKAYLSPDADLTNRVSFDCQIVKPNKDKRNIHFCIMPLFNQENKSSKLICVIQDLTTRRKDEIQREQEQNKANVYLDIANVIFLSLNKDGTVENINKKGCETLGTSKENIIGKNWSKTFLPKKETKAVTEVIKQIVKGNIEDVRYFENNIVTAKGEERLIAWNNSYIKDKDGMILTVLSVGTDITEERQNERALIESEEKFKYVFENSAVGKSLTLPTGEVNTNKAVCDILGYTKDEIKGVKWQELTHPEDVALSQEQINQVLSGKRDNVNFDKRYIRKDGTILWANVHTCIRRDEKNKPLYFMTSLIDITEKKKAEEELKRSETQYRQLFSEMRDGYALHKIICDKKGKPIDYRFLAVNPAFEQMTGLKAKDILNRTVRDVLPLTEPVWIEKYGRVALTGTPLKFDQYHTELGKHFEVNAYQPAPNQFACTFRDITQEKETSKALIENEKRLLAAQTLAQVGNWEFDLDSNTVWGSEETALIYEVDGPYLPFDKVQRLVLPEYREQFKRLHLGLLSGTEEQGDIVIKIKTEKTGTIKFIHNRTVAKTDDAGNIVKIVGVTQDITAQKKLEEELKYLNHHDHLTGLYNRRFLDEQIDRIDLENAFPISVIMGDLNGLKIINDSLGHHIGDELIKEAAHVMKSGCNEDATIVRYGGDEFVAVLPNTDGKEANHIIVRIQSLAGKTKLSGVELSLSFGVATMMQKKEPLKAILTKAEDNMYKHKLNQRSSMHNKTINIIMKTLFEKSDRESAHSNRVSEYCEAIAKQMGFREDDVDEIRIAGLVHDIGKISIEQTVLNKEGPLTENEWIVIRNHPDSGWRILSTSNDFSEIAGFVRAHHERWDGKGYPIGLKGDKIPLEARIIAVADSFDAMTSIRTYRDKFSKERAAEELVRCAGTQFDPHVVDVFVNKVLAQKNQLNN